MKRTLCDTCMKSMHVIRAPWKLSAILYHASYSLNNFVSQIIFFTCTRFAIGPFLIFTELRKIFCTMTSVKQCNICKVDEPTFKRMPLIFLNIMYTKSFKLF